MENESIVVIFRPWTLISNIEDIYLNVFYINGFKLIDKYQIFLNEEQITELAKYENLDFEKFKDIMNMGAVLVCLLQRDSAYTYTNILCKHQ